jgi:hypothetical protein
MTLKGQGGVLEEGVGKGREVGELLCVVLSPKLCYICEPSSPSQFPMLFDGAMSFLKHSNPWPSNVYCPSFPLCDTTPLRQ